VDTRSIEALVLGVGNVLWADEGFGVRAVEALHEVYECPEGVLLLDGGTQGLYLMDYICAARRLLLFDAVDFGRNPGTLLVLRGKDVPAWGGNKLSAHQVGINDLLALAALKGRTPAEMLLIGVQPAELSDFGGSLRVAVKARIADAVAAAVRQLADWGYAPRARTAPPADGLMSSALSLQAYEDGRPSEATACRSGDARFLAAHERGAA